MNIKILMLSIIVLIETFLIITLLIKNRLLREDIEDYEYIAKRNDLTTFPKELLNECHIRIDEELWFAIWRQYMCKYFDYYEFGANNGERYENDVFVCNSYDWENEQEYNFYHKPSGYKIRWYKYAMREAVANMEITPHQFVQICKDSFNSLPEEDRYKIEYDVEEWWE